MEYKRGIGLNNIPELNPQIMKVDELLGLHIPIQLSVLNNKKRLYTPHPWVNPIRLDSVLNMSPEDLLQANEKDPLSCWIVDKYNRQQVLNRLVVMARGNHRGATHLFTTPLNLRVSGTAQLGSEGELLSFDGNYDPKLPIYPFSIFLAHVRACLSKY